MAKYIKGIDRRQLVLFNNCIDDMIDVTNEVRVIDAFVEKINLVELEIKKSIPNIKGTNHYDPRDLLKLYIYGYKNGIRSSRKLEKLCKTNIEVKWLLRDIIPDFRTINEFRKENAKALKNVFKKLVMICNEMEMISGELSQDGTKIRAVNSKEKNYTLNKIDDRLKRIEKHIEEYLREMEEIDKQEETEKKGITLPRSEELEKRLKMYEEEEKKLKKYQKEMEETETSQISLTDKESRLMKNNGRFEVSYNTQVIVDTKGHIVVNYEVDNNPADSGTMEKISKEAKGIIGKEIIKNITDKGYNDRTDMMECLKEGIIPEVTLPRNQKEYELEIEYEENKIREEEEKSKKSEDIKKCLKAGVVPEIYKEYLEYKEIKEGTKLITVEEVEREEISDETLREYAIDNKCFMKSKDGKVYCPMGEILRKKSKNNSRNKYCNKMACKYCKNPCTTAKFKEVVMSEKQVISTRDTNLRKEFNKKGKQKKLKVKKVIYKLKPKEEDIKKRMSTSEHIHGTMKRTDGLTYFLLKGKEKVNAELALYYCGTNLRRMINIVGVERIIEHLNSKKELKEAILSKKDKIYLFFTKNFAEKSYTNFIQVL